MSRKITFLPYRPKNILNKGKRADHWFWTRYSAYPYIGCLHGCKFCYCRERKYSPYDDPEDFAYVIKVKENAADLLYKSLSRVPVDVLFTGDYQAAERKFGQSRRMLEVCETLGFPVFVLERSPLVLRDIDLLQSIHAKARAVVAFSIISTPDAPHYSKVRQFEHLAPPVEKRFAAMQQFSKTGIITGTVFMPILPGLCDDAGTIDSVACWTARHGGQFVLPGGLTLADQQKTFFMNFLQDRFPELIGLYRDRYPDGSYGLTGDQWRTTARQIREACQRYGIHDRIPRPVIPGDKHERNKRIVEQLAERVYSLELAAAPSSQIWKIRKAAWAIEDLEQDIGLIYRTLGIKGIQNIPGIGEHLAPAIIKLIAEI